MTDLTQEQRDAAKARYEAAIAELAAIAIMDMRSQMEEANSDGRPEEERCEMEDIFEMNCDDAGWFETAGDDILSRVREMLTGTFPAWIEEIAEALEQSLPINQTRASDAFKWCHGFYNDETKEWTNEKAKELALELQELIDPME